MGSIIGPAIAAVALGAVVGVGGLLGLHRARGLSGQLLVLLAVAILFVGGTTAIAYWSFAVYVPS